MYPQTHHAPINTQHALEIDPSTVKLPKMQYKGDVITPQRIRKQRALVVEQTTPSEPVVTPLKVTPATGGGVPASHGGAASTVDKTSQAALKRDKYRQSGTTTPPSASPHWELTFAGGRPLQTMQLDVHLHHVPQVPTVHVHGFTCIIKQANTPLLTVPLPLQVASASANLHEGVLSISFQPLLVKH